MTSTATVRTPIPATTAALVVAVAVEAATTEQEYRHPRHHTVAAGTVAVLPPTSSTVNVAGISVPAVVEAEGAVRVFDMYHKDAHISRRFYKCDSFF